MTEVHLFHRSTGNCSKMPRDVLIDKLNGPHGVAYHYTYTAEMLADPTMQTTPPPLSATEWLVALYDCPGYVFSVSYLPLDHPMWRKYDDSHSWRVGMAYEICVGEVWGEPVSPNQPASVQDYADPHMKPMGTLLAAADHHMRFVVDALITGELDGWEGRLDRDDSPGLWWKTLEERALSAADSGLYTPGFIPEAPLFEGIL